MVRNFAEACCSGISGEAELIACFCVYREQVYFKELAQAVVEA